MKAKVFILNDSQSKVTTTTRELVKFSENIYYCIVKDTYELAEIYIKHKGLFIHCIYNSLSRFKQDSRLIKELNEASEDYKNYVEKNNFFGKIAFYVFEKLGYDTTIINKHKLEYEQKHETDTLKRKEYKEAKEKAEKEEQAIYAAKQLSILKSGGNIPIVDLEDILYFKGTKVHARTLFAIRQQNNGRWINKDTGEFNKRTSKKTAQMLFDLVNKIIE